MLYDFNSINESSEKYREHMKRLKTDAEYRECYVKFKEEATREYWSTRSTFKDVYDVDSLPKPLDEFYISHIIRCGGIPKSELKDGSEYIGNCRNSTKATWNSSKNLFVYKRFKFGMEYEDSINHFEDDDGYDLFVPIEVINKD